MRLDPNNAKDVEFMKKFKEPKSGMTLWEIHQRDHLKGGNESDIQHGRQSESPPKSNLGTAKRPGYVRTRTFIDHQWFDSKYESQVWLILRDMERLSKIYDLSRDKEDCRFKFIHNNVLIAQAKWDYSFFIPGIMTRVLADAKSPVTAKFQRLRWQIKMMEAFYQLPVLLFLQGTSDVASTIIKYRDSQVEKEGD